MLQHPGAGAGGERGSADAEALAEVGQEVVEDRGQVGAPLAQRRDAEGEDLQAVEEVGAEGLAGDPPGQVLGADGDEADVGRRPRAPPRGA